MNNTDVLVIIPAFNEEKSIKQVLNDLLKDDWAILVVSDGSSDSTATIVREMGVPVLDLPINLGVGGALRAGFKYAVLHGYKAVVQVDADGQHPVHEIRNLVECANRQDAHLVVGSRFLSAETSMEISRPRRLAMRILAMTASRTVSYRITDATSGFRIIAEPLLTEFSKNFASNYLGDTYEAIISAGRAGYRVREIPAPISPRSNGSSTANTTKAIVLTLKCGFVYGLHLHIRLQEFSDGRKRKR